jgi:transposase InsO family protein
VGRDFDASPAGTVNQKWYGNGTEVPTDEGKLFLDSVLDMGSRRIVGIAMDEHHDAALGHAALAMAVAIRGGKEAIAGVIMTPTKAATADSTGRRNTSVVEVLMGRLAGWMRELTGRAPMKTPGKPSPRQDVERLFWREIVKGLTSEVAAVAVGASGSVAR